MALRATPDEETTVDEFLVRDDLALGADVGERSVRSERSAEGSTERGNVAASGAPRTHLRASDARRTDFRGSRAFGHVVVVVRPVRGVPSRGVVAGGVGFVVAGFVVAAGVVLVANQTHHPEPARSLQTPPNHQFVSLLEHVQRDLLPGGDGVEDEERELALRGSRARSPAVADVDAVAGLGRERVGELVAEEALDEVHQGGVDGPSTGVLVVQRRAARGTARCAVRARHPRGEASSREGVSADGGDRVDEELAGDGAGERVDQVLAGYSRRPGVEIAGSSRSRRRRGARGVSAELGGVHRDRAGDASGEAGAGHGEIRSAGNPTKEGGRPGATRGRRGRSLSVPDRFVS